jgi:thiol-disulfide isomerase/thioredoxin
MAGIYYLSSDDFHVEQGQSGQIMCHKIANIAMILFYSKGCDSCKDFIPKFKTLPTKVNGCVFGMVNVSVDGQKIIKLSQSTITPITYVPFVVLYVNGKPYLEYRGAKDVQQIAQFVFEVSQLINNKQQFSKGQVCQGGTQGIQGYCPIGKPLNDDVCYIQYGDAYDPQGKKSTTQDSMCLSYDKAYGRPPEMKR